MVRPVRIAACVLLAACGGASAGDAIDGAPIDGGPSGGPPDAGPDLSDLVFDTPMLEVVIEMEPDYWDQLRHQRKTRHSAYGRENCRDAPIPNPYSWFPATVSIDGDDLGVVGVRKKGHLGSQSTLRSEERRVGK